MGRKPKAELKERKPSGLDAAVRVLREADKPMKMDEAVKVALEKECWQTGGKTPAATVYAAVIREIAAKGAESRFRRAEVKTTTDVPSGGRLVEIALTDSSISRLVPVTPGGFGIGSRRLCPSGTESSSGKEPALGLGACHGGPASLPLARAVILDSRWL